MSIPNAETQATFRAADLTALAVRVNALYAARHPPKASATSNAVPTIPRTCLRCGFEWQTPADKPAPRACPRCKVRTWQTPPAPRMSDTRRKCLRCGYEWGARKAVRPCACPACGARDWDRARILNKCLRCGHEWEASKPTPYRTCPACHSRNWDYLPGYGHGNTQNAP